MLLSQRFRFLDEEQPNSLLLKKLQQRRLHINHINQQTALNRPVSLNLYAHNPSQQPLLAKLDKPSTPKTNTSQKKEPKT